MQLVIFLQEKTMNIQIHTDHNIKGHKALINKVDSMVKSALSWFSSHVTRVNVHLSEENGNKKTGHDVMRCMIEAHLEVRQPIAVTHQAVSLDEAVEGASDKLAGMIGTILGRMQSRERLEDAPEPEESDSEAEEQSFAAPLQIYGEKLKRRRNPIPHNEGSGRF
jgi:hypothetical protein